MYLKRKEDESLHKILVTCVQIVAQEKPSLLKTDLINRLKKKFKNVETEVILDVIKVTIGFRVLLETRNGRVCKGPVNCVTNVTSHETG